MSLCTANETVHAEENAVWLLSAPALTTAGYLGTGFILLTPSSSESCSGTKRPCFRSELPWPCQPEAWPGRAFPHSCHQAGVPVLQLLWGPPTQGPPENRSWQKQTHLLSDRKPLSDDQPRRDKRTPCGISLKQAPDETTPLLGCLPLPCPALFTSLEGFSSFKCILTKCLGQALLLRNLTSDCPNPT